MDIKLILNEIAELVLDAVDTETLVEFANPECEFCQGRGYTEFEQAHPYGDTVAYETLAEPCENDCFDVARMLAYIIENGLTAQEIVALLRVLQLV